MNPNATSASRKPMAMDAPLTEPYLCKAQAAGLIPAAGELSASSLPRLAASVVSVDGPVQWTFGPQASGRTSAGPAKRWWLELVANVTCSCERCLAPVAVTIRSRRGFEFLASAGLAQRRAKQIEEQAELDADAEQVDLVIDEDRPTLLGLIEDELLLELPMAPKHESCPLPA